MQTVGKAQAYTVLQIAIQLSTHLSKYFVGLAFSYSLGPCEGRWPQFIEPPEPTVTTPLQIHIPDRGKEGVIKRLLDCSTFMVDVNYHSCKCCRRRYWLVHV